LATGNGNGGNGNGIGNAIVDPGAEEISTAPAAVTPQQENLFFANSARQHQIDLQKLELGFLGKFFGGGAKAGTNIAGFTAGVAFVLFAVTFLIKGDDMATVRSGLLSVITSAMGYIFGASRKD
jgi:hypothetical protein